MKKEIFVDSQPIKLRKDGEGNYWLHLPPNVDLNLSNIAGPVTRIQLVTWAEGCFENEKQAIRDTWCQKYDERDHECSRMEVEPHNRELCTECTCLKP